MTQQIKVEGLKTGIPYFQPGDTVRVHAKVVEGENERIQVFEGLVIGRHGGSISETFTVRKTSFGVPIERIFPLHSPRIDKIEVVKHSKVRRAKLNYLRKLSGKSARLASAGEMSDNPAVAAVVPEAPVAEKPAAAPAATEAKPEGKK